MTGGPGWLWTSYSKSRMAVWKARLPFQSGDEEGSPNPAILLGVRAKGPSHA